MKLAYASHVEKTHFAVLAFRCRLSTLQKKVRKIENIKDKIDRIVYDEESKLSKIYFNCRLNVDESDNLIAQLGA